MNLGQFKNVLLQVFLLPVIALLVTAGALYLQISGANSTVNLIQQSDARISQTTLIAKIIADEESGLRGYEATSDNRFLQQFVDAESHAEVELERLKEMTGADAEERHSIFDLKNEHQTWEDAFALPLIQTVRAGGQAGDVELNLHGKSLMDAVQKDLNDTIHDAEQSRMHRIALWQRQVHSMLLALLMLALGMGVLIGMFTRNRLHAVSDAYRTTLDRLGGRAEELFQSEQQLRTTLDSIGDGVITCDAEGCIQMMNPVARELTGWSQMEAIGRPLDEIFQIVDSATHKPVETPVAKVKRLDRTVGVASHTVLIRKDRTRIEIADSAAPIRSKTGGTIGIVFVFRDITFERKTQEALLANEKLAVAGRLAATIAHEIHNPLDSVSNLLYLMSTGASKEEAEQYMDMAQQELMRVTQISRAMLGLYRESKAPVEVNLKEMLQEILLLMERRFSNEGVTVTTDMPEAISVAAFPAELRQVFSNLITNAVEAAGPRGQIKVSLCPQAAGVDRSGENVPSGAVIRVADDGPGIPKDIQ
ncbi:MAG: PAS domain S-box protein, partial [Acidobacteriota bacterium]|nr:PAS domain S-box protein [Acidobacteriota bacterium]